MKFKSTNFSNGGEIPQKFTCLGKGVSPSLEWSDLPASTEALALSVIDPDAPGGDFVHWLIYNIKPETDGIKEDGSLTGLELENDDGSKGYYPPCPPSGKHRYEFTLYALDRELSDVNKDNFLEKMEEYQIDQVTITGLFGRS